MMQQDQESEVPKAEGIVVKGSPTRRIVLTRSNGTIQRSAAPSEGAGSAEGRVDVFDVWRLFRNIVLNITPFVPKQHRTFS